MILQYYSADNRTIEIDLFKEYILCWQIDYNCGWAEGNLCIDFKYRVGIYPPISKIINYQEVMKYLNDKYLKWEITNDHPVLPFMNRYDITSDIDLTKRIE